MGAFQIVALDLRLPTLEAVYKRFYEFSKWLKVAGEDTGHGGPPPPFVETRTAYMVIKILFLDSYLIKAF